MKKLFRCENWDTCPDESVVCENREPHIHEHPMFTARGAEIRCPAVTDPEAEGHIRQCVLFAQFEEEAPESPQEAVTGKVCPFRTPPVYCGSVCALWCAPIEGCSLRTLVKMVPQAPVPEESE